MIPEKQFIAIPRMIKIIRNAPELELGFHAVLKLNWVEEDVILFRIVSDYSSLTTLNLFYRVGWGLLSEAKY